MDTIPSLVVKPAVGLFTALAVVLWTKRLLDRAYHGKGDF